jgi:DNA excision repair protein ERCC-2
MYSQILNIDPLAIVAYSLTFSRQPVLPIVVARGTDQTLLSTQPELKENLTGFNNYGRLLLELSKQVPDGVVVFFPSFGFLYEILQMWTKDGRVTEILENKVLFIEPQHQPEVALTIDSYKRACDTGRGAMLLAIANGRTCEGVDWSGPYGRFIVVLGMPEPQKTNQLLRTRSEYLDLRFQISKEDFLLFNSIRIATQCFARILNSKKDYGIVLLADFRYNRQSARLKMPQWIRDFITKDQSNLSVDDAIEQAKAFYLKVSQVYNAKPEAVAPGDEILRD